jgi:hypothetical protein
MPFNLNDFKGALKLEGARPTLFSASINFPVGASDRDFTFHCKAAQLPGKTIGTIEVPYFGRKIKVAGDQTFAEWTVTVIHEEKRHADPTNVRSNFELWMSNINTTVGNVRTLSNYKANAAVRQYAKVGGSPIQLYSFKGMFPTDISPIDVSWESNDTIEEFTVTLQYDWWESQSVLQ